MLFAVRFTDKEDPHGVRDKFLQAQIEWLAEHKLRVLVGGSLRDNLRERPVDSLWIVDAESKKQIEELMRSDPFWINGLRQGYEILDWSKAFADKKVPV